MRNEMPTALQDRDMALIRRVAHPLRQAVHLPQARPAGGHDRAWIGTAPSGPKPAPTRATTTPGRDRP